MTSPKSLSAMRVRDLMTSEVTTLKRNDKLSVADDVMRLGRIRHLPVVDDADETKLVGLVSLRDLLRGSLACALGIGPSEQQKLLDRYEVKEIMTTSLVTTSPAAPLHEAAQTMSTRKLGCLPVVEAGKLVGILTEGDFVALAARS